MHAARRDLKQLVAMYLGGFMESKGFVCAVQAVKVSTSEARNKQKDCGNDSHFFMLAKASHKANADWWQKMGERGKDHCFHVGENLRVFD